MEEKGRLSIELNVKGCSSYLIDLIKNLPKIKQDAVNTDAIWLSYLTQLSIALHSGGALQASDLQLLESTTENETIAFSIFKISTSTINKLLTVTDDQSVLAILEPVQTLNKNMRLVYSQSEMATVSLDGVDKDYLEDVKKYPKALQRIFMDIFNTYAPPLSGMGLDDLHYELTGTFNAVDNNPKRALEEARYVQDNFGWDLTPFIEYAEQAKKAQVQRLVLHDLSMSVGEKRIAEQEKISVELDKSIADALKILKILNSTDKKDKL